MGNYYSKDKQIFTKVINSNFCLDDVTFGEAIKLLQKLQEKYPNGKIRYDCNNSGEYSLELVHDILETDAEHAQRLQGFKYYTEQNEIRERALYIELKKKFEN